jgi:hypothetical protein
MTVGLRRCAPGGPLACENKPTAHASLTMELVPPLTPQAWNAALRMAPCCEGPREESIGVAAEGPLEVAVRARASPVPAMLYRPQVRAAAPLLEFLPSSNTTRLTTRRNEAAL